MTNQFVTLMKGGQGCGLKKFLQYHCQKKMKKSRIMIVEFIVEHDGYLQLTPEEHTTKLSEHFLNMVLRDRGIFDGRNVHNASQNFCDIV